MNFRAELWDRHDVPRGEFFRVIEGNCSWVLNGVGSAQLMVYADSPLATVSLMRGAPRLIMYTDAGNWGGVLKRQHKQAGMILVIGAWSKERLLKDRQTSEEASLDGCTNGYIARTLLNEINAASPTGVVAGAIHMGGGAHYYSLRQNDFLDRLQKMASMEEHDFEVTWDGYLNWMERKGSDKWNVVLEEGRNVVMNPTWTYSEDHLVNDQYCVGEGTTWADKIRANKFDTSSQGIYGLWQRTNVFGSISQQETLDLKAATLLANRKDAGEVIDLSIVDRPSGIFNAFREGDRVRCVFPSYGFKAGVDKFLRVLARELNFSTSVMRVIVERS